MNYLTILGNVESLDKIENGGIILSNEEVNNDLNLVYLKDNYFGNNCKIERKTTSCLKITFDFRNIPPNQYLEFLLHKFKNCWFKNEYITEDGDCGLWIGEYKNGKKEIQKTEWFESPSSIEFGMYNDI